MDENAVTVAEVGQFVRLDFVLLVFGVVRGSFAGAENLHAFGEFHLS